MSTLALGRFDAVTLDELVADAALLTRVDRKYIVPRRDLDGILAALDAGTRVLEIDGARDFAYESVYFDTPDLLSFRMAAQPRRRRFKLRTRSYLDVGSAYLEIKTRGARGTTVKERSEYDLELRAELTDEARDDAASAFDAIGVDGERADELAATLTTHYRRATLLAPDGSARATIDTELRWDEPGGAGFALPALAIVETKSPAAASRIDRLLWRAGHRPSTVSKYATGLAALHAELPRNRWARVLRGPFAPPPDDAGPTAPTGSVARQYGSGVRHSAAPTGTTRPDGSGTRHSADPTGAAARPDGPGTRHSADAIDVAPTSDPTGTAAPTAVTGTPRPTDPTTAATGRRPRTEETPCAAA